MVPHFAHPFRVDASGSVAVLDQDTDEEIAQCVQVLLSTTVGERIEVPTYGIPNPVFRNQSTVDDANMAAAVRKWEPRATALVHSTVIDESLRHVLVELELSQDLLAGRS
jgi:phage baseplate assembly protein W